MRVQETVLGCPDASWWYVWFMILCEKTKFWLKTIRRDRSHPGDVRIVI